MHEKQGNNTAAKLVQIGSMEDASATGAVFADSNVDNEACASDQTNLEDLGMFSASHTTIITFSIFIFHFSCCN
jgi:hypothetical protein